MADANDSFLLREFAERQSESAFSELVERHVHFVYSVAMRYVGNPPDAQDVAQAVFVILARKSARLCGRTTLTGWLYETTRLTARQLLRTKNRRLAREQEAYMQSTFNPSGGDPLWHQLAPHLEDAMSRLRAADRELLALRFYENKTGAEAATLLGIGAAAAHKRTNRALEKLQKFFVAHGVTSTADAIAGAVSANSMLAVPAGLAKTISAVALTKGATTSASTLTLVKGALKVMVWTKTKMIVAGTVTTLLVGGASIPVTIVTIHAVRRAFAPNIAGTWEGVATLEDAGVKNGQEAQAHVVLSIIKKNGVYQATTDWPELGKKDVPLLNVAYDYPNLVIQQTVRDTWNLKLNPHGTEMFWDRYIHFIEPAPVRFWRTTSPTPVPDPLTESDFAPRPDSPLQGYWEGEVGTGPGAAPVDVKIARQADGTFRAEFDDPMEGVQGRPMTVSYNPPMVEFRPADGAGLFRGQLNDSGTEISGSWAQGGQSLPASVRRVDYQAEHAHDSFKDYWFTSENDLQGHWKGAWTSPLGNHRDPIRQTLDIAKLPDGSYSATMANVDGLGVDAPIPASVFEYSPPNLHAEWKWVGWTYDGKLENGKLIGTWSEGGAGFSLVFERQN